MQLFSSAVLHYSPVRGTNWRRPSTWCWSLPWPWWWMVLLGGRWVPCIVPIQGPCRKMMPDLQVAITALNFSNVPMDHHAWWCTCRLSSSKSDDSSVMYWLFTCCHLSLSAVNTMYLLQRMYSCNEKIILTWEELCICITQMWYVPFVFVLPIFSSYHPSLLFPPFQLVPLSRSFLTFRRVKM